MRTFFQHHYFEKTSVGRIVEIKVTQRFSVLLWGQQHVLQIKYMQDTHQVLDLSLEHGVHSNNKGGGGAQHF